MTKIMVTIQGQRFVTSELCAHDHSKTAVVNLIKFHTVVKHNEKVCQAQNLGFDDHGQGHRL